MVNTVRISKPTVAVAELLERVLCVREVVGSDSGRVIPKTFKIVQAALSLGVQHLESGTCVI